MGITFQLADGNEKSKIVLTGSSTLAPLILEISKRYEKANPGLRVDVQTGGSSRGIADARKGLADIGMSSRALKKSETDLHFETIAMDGVAALVHKSNPVTDLTDQQLRDIFTGKIKNWNEVGGKDLEIVVVNRAEGRSELELFTKRYKLNLDQIKATLIVGENAHSVKTISKNIKGITYMSIGHAIKDIEFGAQIKLLSLNGVKATVENVKKGQFPLSRPLILITKMKPSGSIEKFIQFAKSEKVTEIIEKQSFVPVSN